MPYMDYLLLNEKGEQTIDTSKGSLQKPCWVQEANSIYVTLLKGQNHRNGEQTSRGRVKEGWAGRAVGVARKGHRAPGGDGHGACPDSSVSTSILW
jgi:hypothetical protein